MNKSTLSLSFLLLVLGWQFTSCNKPILDEPLTVRVTGTFFDVVRDKPLEDFSVAVTDQTCGWITSCGQVSEYVYSDENGEADLSLEVINSLEDCPLQLKFQENRLTNNFYRNYAMQIKFSGRGSIELSCNSLPLTRMQETLFSIKLIPQLRIQFKKNTNDSLTLQKLTIAKYDVEFDTIPYYDHITLLHSIQDTFHVQIEYQTGFSSDSTYIIDHAIDNIVQLSY